MCCYLPFAEAEQRGSDCSVHAGSANLTAAAQCKLASSQIIARLDGCSPPIEMHFAIIALFPGRLFASFLRVPGHWLLILKRFLNAWPMNLF
jgi:hypothetical protein